MKQFTGLQCDIASGPPPSLTLVDLRTNPVDSYTDQTADDFGKFAKKHWPEFL